VEQMDCSKASREVTMWSRINSDPAAQTRFSGIVGYAS